MASKKHVQGPWAYDGDHRVYCRLVTGDADGGPFELRGRALCGRYFGGAFTWAEDCDWHRVCPECASFARSGKNRDDILTHYRGPR